MINRKLERRLVGQSVKRIKNKIRKSEKWSRRVKLKLTKSGPKMSKVILDFAEPFLPSPDDLESCESLIALAVIGWNLGTIPHEERETAFNTIRTKFPPLEEKEVNEILKK